MKRNGFCLPLHSLQVAAWVAVTVLGGLYYGVVGRGMGEMTGYVMLGVYSGALLSTGVTCFVCTKIDPTDLAVQVKLGKSVPNYDYTKFPRLCIKCSTHVGARSKHCHKCERCAADFDHHCDWLNNCIGKANYRWFIALILSLQVLVLIELSASLYQLKSITDDGKTAEELRNRFSMGDSGYTYIGILVFVAVLCVCIATSNGYLILFHGYLGLKRLTTYEFILNRRNNRSKISPATVTPAAALSVLQIDIPLTDSRPIVPHCTPAESGTKSIDVKSVSETPAEREKYAPSRTLDVTSLPSFVERPTELEFGASYKQRKAREESVTPGDEERDLLKDESQLRLHSSPALAELTVDMN